MRISQMNELPYDDVPPDTQIAADNEAWNTAYRLPPAKTQRLVLCEPLSADYPAGSAGDLLNRQSVAGLPLLFPSDLTLTPAVAETGASVSDVVLSWANNFDPEFDLLGQSVTWPSGYIELGVEYALYEIPDPLTGEDQITLTLDTVLGDAKHYITLKRAFKTYYGRGAATVGAESTIEAYTSQLSSTPEQAVAWPAASGSPDYLHFVVPEAQAPTKFIDRATGLMVPMVRQSDLTMTNLFGLAATYQRWASVFPLAGAIDVLASD